jgi:hypothetical protein
MWTMIRSGPLGGGTSTTAVSSQRDTLQFYQDRRMVVLVGRTRAVLASLPGQRATLKP